MRILLAIILHLIPATLSPSTRATKSLKKLISLTNKHIVCYRKASPTSKHLKMISKVVKKNTAVLGSNICMALSIFEDNARDNDSHVLYIKCSLYYKLLHRTWENLNKFSKTAEITLLERDSFFDMLVGIILEESDILVDLVCKSVQKSRIEYANCHPENGLQARVLFLPIYSCFQEVSKLTNIKDPKRFNFMDFKWKYITSIEKMNNSCINELCIFSGSFNIDEIVKFHALKDTYAQLSAFLMSHSDLLGIPALNLALIRLETTAIFYRYILVLAEVYTHNGSALNLPMVLCDQAISGHSVCLYDGDSVAAFQVINHHFKTTYTQDIPSSRLLTQSEISSLHYRNISYVQKEQHLLRYYLHYVKASKLKGKSRIDDARTESLFNLYTVTDYLAEDIQDLPFYESILKLLEVGPERFTILCSGLLTPEFFRFILNISRLNMAGEIEVNLEIQGAKKAIVAMKALENALGNFITITICWVLDILSKLNHNENVRSQLTSTYHFYMLIHTFDRILMSVSRLKDAAGVLRSLLELKLK